MLYCWMLPFVPCMSVSLFCCWSATSCPPQGNSFRALRQGAERDVTGLPAHAGSCLASSAEFCCRIGLLTAVIARESILYSLHISPSLFLFFIRFVPLSPFFRRLCSADDRSENRATICTSSVNEQPLQQCVSSLRTNNQPKG